MVVSPPTLLVLLAALMSAKMKPSPSDPGLNWN
jgi:hypothetical protein